MEKYKKIEKIENFVSKKLNWHYFFVNDAFPSSLLGSR
jgi:hypothetical protein